MNAAKPVSPPRPVWFPNWAEVLARAGLPDGTRAQYRAAIEQYLRFCKQTRQPATVASARQFMREREAQRPPGGTDLAGWKAALNWFFRAAGRAGARRDSSAHPRSGVPPSPDTLSGSAIFSPSDAEKGIEAEQAVGGRGPVMTGVPTLGAADLGQTEWERRLIQELRGRHYRWRTEQTYEPVEG